MPAPTMQGVLGSVNMARADAGRIPFSRWVVQLEAMESTALFSRAEPISVTTLSMMFGFTASMIISACSATWVTLAAGADAGFSGHLGQRSVLGS